MIKYVLEFLGKTHTTQKADVLDVLSKITKRFLGISNK